MHSANYRKDTARNRSDTNTARWVSTVPNPVFSAYLFAGAGGHSRAVTNVANLVKVAVELAPITCKTYRHNLIVEGAPTLIEGDIADIQVSKIASHFKRAACDLVLGGFMSAGGQIGNAMPITMGEAVLRPINSYIENYAQ